MVIQAESIMAVAREDEDGEVVEVVKDVIPTRCAKCRHSQFCCRCAFIRRRCQIAAVIELASVLDARVKS